MATSQTGLEVLNGTVVPAAPKAIDAYYGGDRDAQVFARENVVITLAIFALYGLTVYFHWSPWVLAGVAMALIPRWSINTHELFHLREPSQLDLTNRIILLPFTPFSLGYREFRRIHFDHHRSPAAYDDPDAFHILGGSAKAFVGTMTVPEQAAVRWVLARGVSGNLAREGLMRLLTFISLAAAGGKTFFWLWLPIRISFALGDFVFFHLLHYRDGARGNFGATAPPWLSRIASIFLGATLVNAVLYHDRHHDNPRVAARFLPEIEGWSKPADSLK